jgi:hypothetical protein
MHSPSTRYWYSFRLNAFAEYRKLIFIYAKCIRRVPVIAFSNSNGDQLEWSRKNREVCGSGNELGWTTREGYHCRLRGGSFISTWVQKKLWNFQTVEDTAKRFGSSETTLNSTRLPRNMFIHPSNGVWDIDKSRGKSWAFPKKSVFFRFFFCTHRGVLK